MACKSSQNGASTDGGGSEKERSCRELHFEYKLKELMFDLAGLIESLEWKRNFRESFFHQLRA